MTSLMKIYMPSPTIRPYVIKRVICGLSFLRERVFLFKIHLDILRVVKIETKMYTI